MTRITLWALSFTKYVAMRLFKNSVLCILLWHHPGAPSYNLNELLAENGNPRHNKTSSQVVWSLASSPSRDSYTSLHHRTNNPSPRGGWRRYWKGYYYKLWRILIKYCSVDNSTFSATLQDNSQHLGKWELSSDGICSTWGTQVLPLQLLKNCEFLV